MSKTQSRLLSLFAVVAIIVAAVWGIAGFKKKRARVQMAAVCENRILEAKQKAAEAIARRADTFADFIQSRKSGAKSFSEEIVSLYGKWRAVKPFVPFTDKEGHKQYVEEEFANHIFTVQDLASVVKIAIEGGLKDIASIENELAASLQKEILGNSRGSGDIPIVEADFKEALNRLVAASKKDAAFSAGSLVVSEVSTQVATQVLVRLGVSAGILASGAANSWWSFGASLLIGIVVDLVWEWIDDPAGDVERELRASLDKLSTDGREAILQEMTEILTQRSELWSKTVQEMLP